ncbi:MAG TPA: hypothetical protein VJQ58_01445 [Burkholderiales bacterium]|nr:hypothetical protein [Burkholderiales bacterium]
MKTTLIAIATAFALGALAGCDRPENQTTNQTTTPSPAAGGSSAAPTTPQSNTPSTPANLGKPSAAERSPSAQPPVQGREDVRQPEQKRDFQHKGDEAGPKPGG